MKLGIDFGISYSAAASSMRGKIKSIKFNDEEHLRTAAYFLEKVPSLSDCIITPELQQKADAYFRQAKVRHTRDVTEANLRRAQAM